MESVREEMLRELDRITVRLASLNPERLDAMDESVYLCATAIWSATQGNNHELNRVGPTAYAAQLTILTRDLLMQKPDGEPDAAAALTELRRILPYSRPASIERKRKISR
jgi:hypothetical protein